jgi:hypothetical protein
MRCCSASPPEAAGAEVFNELLVMEPEPDRLNECDESEGKELPESPREDEGNCSGRREGVGMVGGAGMVNEGGWLMTGGARLMLGPREDTEVTMEGTLRDGGGAIVGGGASEGG